MKQIFIVMTLVIGFYVGHGQSPDSLRVVELDRTSPLFVASQAQGIGVRGLTLDLIQRQHVPSNISNQFYSFPFPNFEQGFRYFGFAENHLKFVYTTKGINDLLIQKFTLNTSQILDTLDTKIKSLANQIDDLPCNLLLDENSPCYKSLVEKIIGKIEKEYVLTPKNK